MVAQVLSMETLELRLYMYILQPSAMILPTTIYSALSP